MHNNHPHNQENLNHPKRLNTLPLFTIDLDLFLGYIYISPENSKYTSLEAFNEIESELIQLSSGCDYFSLIG
jgi:hypothetical protein